jgi:hypothetical protein
MDHPLRIAVLITGAWALLALAAMVLRARSYGRPRYYSRAQGNPIAGVAYVFGPGMSPLVKESVREHLPTYFGGVGYHLGIFTSLGWLALVLAGVTLDGPALGATRILCLIGALCGASLLIKRAVTPHLRGLSAPDDFLSNALATAFAALAFASTLSATLVPAFLAEASALFLYLPLGKIKHCFFFFTTRYYLGAHFGRRGTLPPAA